MIIIVGNDAWAIPHIVIHIHTMMMSANLVFSNQNQLLLSFCPAVSVYVSWRALSLSKWTHPFELIKITVIILLNYY